MIDTIAGYKLIDRESFNPKKDFLKGQENPKGITSLNWKVKNINFKAISNKDGKIRLSYVGSLSKFYYGNNLASLDLKTSKKAVHRLSEAIGVDLGTSTITRIDYGFNIPTNFPVNYYINSLKQHPRLNYNNSYYETRYFETKTGNLVLCFYDKRKELLSKNQVIPNRESIFLEGNILKYEIRITKRVAQRLNLSNSKLDNILSEAVNQKLNKLWRDKYFEITKEDRSIHFSNTPNLNKYNGLIG